MNLILVQEKQTVMNMNSIKTLAYSLLIIFLFSYVSEGILLAFELKKTRRNNWIKIALIGLLFISTLILLWAPYHVFGQTAADGLFTLAFTFYAAVMVIGGGLRALAS
jgi:uncharacterized membrane protein YesL